MQRRLLGSLAALLAALLLRNPAAATASASASAPPAHAAAAIRWWSTTNTSNRTQTIKSAVNPSHDLTCDDYSLATTGVTLQTIQGFGACFNELGWDALQSLPAASRAEALRDFWHPTEGMGLVYNRVPVGGNDYADGWYSHDEMPAGEQDLTMKRFSVARDEKKIILYIQEAQKLMALGSASQHLFASAWSPPMWMKQNQNYSGCSSGTCSKANPNGCNSGTEGQPPNALFQDPAVLDAYSLYLSKFVTAYKAHAIPVTAMMVQNEPYSGGCNYPKCEWTGVQMRDFILEYAGPRFAKDHGNATKMWLGTLNTFDFLECPNTVLSDIATKDMIGGAALQYAGKGMIERVAKTWPDLPLIQSESECGDGQNTWDYAIYIFDLMRHYLGNGVVGYTYWNPILNGTNNGSSHWGWKQNSMITVHEGKATRTPEFHVFAHYAKTIKPGSVRLEVRGDWAGSAIVARNPPKSGSKTGDVAIVVMNPHVASRQFKVR